MRLKKQASTYTLINCCIYSHLQLFNYVLRKAYIPVRNSPSGRPGTTGHWALL